VAIYAVNFTLRIYLMLDSKFVRRFVLSLSLVSAACVVSGCGGTPENTVVTGELTPEQEAERNNVTMPGAPSETGDVTAPATPK